NSGVSSRDLLLGPEPVRELVAAVAGLVDLVGAERDLLVARLGPGLVLDPLLLACRCLSSCRAHALTSCSGRVGPPPSGYGRLAGAPSLTVRESPDAGSAPE